MLAALSAAYYTREGSPEPNSCWNHEFLIYLFYKPPTGHRHASAFPSTHYSKVRTHPPRSKLSRHWTAHTSAKETCSKSARGYQDAIYVAWHTLLQKNLHPVSGTSSTLCPVAFTHAGCAEGHSAHSFKPREAAPWGGRARCKNLTRGASVSKQPRPDIYILPTPAQHFCKSSISQRFGAQPWTNMQQPDSHGARSIPQSRQTPSGLTGAATITVPLQSAPWHPPRAQKCCHGQAAACEPLRLWEVWKISWFFPHLLKQNSFNDRQISMLKE